MGPYPDSILFCFLDLRLSCRNSYYNELKIQPVSQYTKYVELTFDLSLTFCKEYIVSKWDLDQKPARLSLWPFEYWINMYILKKIKCKVLLSRCFYCLTILNCTIKLEQYLHQKEQTGILLVIWNIKFSWLSHTSLFVPVHTDVSYDWDCHTTHSWPSKITKCLWYHQTKNAVSQISADIDSVSVYIYHHTLINVLL